MEFELTDEQRMIRDTVREVARSEFAPRAKEIDETGRFPAENFQRLTDLGLMGLPVPERRDYQTLAGFVLDRLRHLPAIGESVEHRGFTFEVVDLESDVGHRADEIGHGAARVEPHPLDAEGAGIEA